MTRPNSTLPSSSGDGILSSGTLDGGGADTALSADFVPVLTSLSTLGDDRATTGVELHFNTAMAAGTGTIWITDGAVQTVIDRATGLPTMRITGATDTHAISVSSANISGSIVTLNVDGLVSGHDYHVYMDGNALTSAAGHLAFGGLRDAALGNAFTTPSTEGYIDYYDDGPSGTDGITSKEDMYFTGKFNATPADGMYVHLVIGNQLDSYVMDPDGELYWEFNGEGRLANGEYTITAELYDKDDHLVSTVNRPITVDNTHPVVTDWQSGDETPQYGVGNDIVLHFSKPVYWQDGESLTDGIRIRNTDWHNGGEAYTYITPDESHFSDNHQTLTLKASELHLATGNSYDIELPYYNLTDLAGNSVNYDGLAFDTSGPYVDVVNPAEEYIETPTSSGTVGIGATIEFRIGFSEAVQLADAGANTIQLNNGAHAVYDAAGSTSTELHYLYTVQAGDAATDGLDLMSYNALAGHIEDAAGNLLDETGVYYGGLHTTSGYGANITIDTTVPNAISAPVLDDGSDTDTKGDNTTTLLNPAIHGSGAAANATIRVYLDGVSQGTVKADASGNWTYSALNLPGGGDWHLTATQKTGANESVKSAALTLTVQAAPGQPDTPHLAAGSDTGASASDGYTSDTTPTLTGFASATGGQIWVYDGDNLLGQADVGADKSWSFTTSALGEGDHGITVKQVVGAYDSAFSAVATVHIDTTAPATPPAPVLDAASDTGISNSDQLTNDATPTLAGDVAATDGTIKVYDGAALLGSTTVGSDGHWTFTVPDAKALADGAHHLTITHADLAGNASAASSALDIQVDTAAPTLTGKLVEGTAGTGDFFLLFSERVYFPADAAIDMQSGSGGSVHDTLTGTASTADGSHGRWGYDNAEQPNSLIFLPDTPGSTVTLALTQGHLTDAAGNAVNFTPQAIAFPASQHAAPARPTLDAASDSGISPTDGVTNDDTPTLYGTAGQAGGYVRIYDIHDSSTTLLGTAAVGGDKNWTFTTPAGKALANGAHDIAVDQVDADGYVSAKSTALSIEIDKTAPTLQAAQGQGSPYGGSILLTFDQMVYLRSGSSITVHTDDDTVVFHGIDQTSGGPFDGWDYFQDGDTAWGIVLHPTLTDDSHITVQVSQGALVDEAGNVVNLGVLPITFPTA